MDKALIKHIIANKQRIITLKKRSIKNNVILRTNHFAREVEISKAFSGDTPKVKVAINSTNIFDSHRDVHFPTLWNKSLKETKFLDLNESHQGYDFRKVIADGDDLKAYVQEMSFKELGWDYQGTSEVLIFEADLKDRNPYMIEQYRKGYVRQHSVEMGYVRLLFAANDKDYKDELAIWDQYIDQVANKDEAAQVGYFWAVLEAKLYGGAAVTKASNVVTPLFEFYEPQEKALENYIEPSNDTQKENWKEFIRNLKN